MYSLYFVLVFSWCYFVILYASLLANPLRFFHRNSIRIASPLLSNGPSVRTSARVTLRRFCASLDLAVVLA